MRSSEEMMTGLLGMIQVTDSWQLGWVRLPSYVMNSEVVGISEDKDNEVRLVEEPERCKFQRNWKC